jgi:tetratricopeptide (TPR) repeat protein
MARNEKRPSAGGILQDLIEGGLLILLLVTPLIFYPKVQNLSFLPKRTFIQLIVCLLWILWIIKSFPKKKLLVFKHPILLAILLWILWSGLSIFWAINKYSALTLWLHWFLTMIACIVITYTIESLNKIDRLIFFGVVGAAAVSILGILQYILGTEIIPQAAVPAATFFNPNVAAQYITLMIPFSIMLFLAAFKPSQIWIITISLGLMLVFIYYAKTRAAWLAFLTSLFFILLFISMTKSWKMLTKRITKQKIIPLTLAIILIILMFNIPPQVREKTQDQPSDQIVPYPKEINYGEAINSLFHYQQGTIAIRIALWLNSLQMIKDNPLLGVGLDNWYIHYPLYHNIIKEDKVFSLDQQPTRLHNSFLQLLAETSLVGLISFILIFFIFFLRLFKIYFKTNSPEIKIRLLFILMAVICFIVNSLFTFPLRRSMPPLILMVSLAFFIALEKMGEQDHGDLPLFKSKTMQPIMVLCSLIFMVGLILFNVRIIRADAHLLKSIFHNHKKNWSEARQEAEQAKNLIPWRHEIWYELSVANHRLGNYEEAIRTGLKALRFHPNLINGYLNLSQIYMKRGDFSKAQKNILRALAIKPDLAEAVFTLGLIKERQSLIEEAIESYTETIAIDKKNALAYLHLAIIYYRQANFTQAQEYFQKTIILNPYLKGPHYYLGLICSQQKRWDQAIPFYKEAIRKNPKAGIIHVNIAVAYYNLDKHDAALYHLNIGKQLGVYQAVIVLKKLYPQKSGN